MIEILARRVAAWRQRMEFITPPDLSTDDNDQYMVTYRDVLLSDMGQVLIHLMHTTQTMAQESPDAMKYALSSMIAAAQEVHDSIAAAAQKNETTPVYITHQQAMYGKLVLIAEELGEVAECAIEERSRDFWTEMADVHIRWSDIVGTAILAGHDPHMTQIVAQKMERNEKRSVRHGKKKFL